MEKTKSALILLSRQNLRPCLSNEWVRGLVQAVNYVKANNYELLSSIGTPNWEIITACASVHGIKLKLIVPVLAGQDKEQKLSDLRNEFALSDTLFTINWFDAIDSKKMSEEHFKRRDEIIFRAADVLIPISIRPNGNLSHLIQSAKESGKEIINDFAVKYLNTKSKLAYTVDVDLLSEQIKQLNRNYIIHWTRATNGPWPKERQIDYYGDILNSTEYPRTALGTLKRIVNSRQIIGTTKNMPGKISTVSLSGLDPVDTIGLMRWRARIRQMSFEPYGIGIKKNTALTLGVRPVQYYDSKRECIPQSVPKWLTQSTGRISDWRNEDEFRYWGDLDLSKLPREKLIAVTHKSNEAKEFEKRTGIRTVWFCD